MFRKDLARRLQAIFDFPKSTYLAPSDSFEQDTLFIEITEAHCRLSGTDRATARVSGFVTVFAQADKLPFGFFQKRIQRAEHDFTRNLFFQNETDLPDSPARMQDLHERRVPFLFLYDAQYDPDKGELTDLTMELEA